MKSLPALLLVLLLGCWEQFDPSTTDDDDISATDDDAGDDDTTPVDDDDTTPVDDDDTTPVDDDDSTPVDDDDDSSDDDDFTDDVDPDDDSADDDDSAVGDDDSSAGDDDSSAGDDDSVDPCDGPVQMDVDVTLLDPSGAPTTTLSTTQPLTVHFEVRNLGGTSNPFFYPSSRLFSWSLWYPNGNPVTAGPSCLAVFTPRTFACGAPPEVAEDDVYPVESVSQNPTAPGPLELRVDSIHFGVQTFPVTVP